MSTANPTHRRPATSPRTMSSSYEANLVELIELLTVVGFALFFWFVQLLVAD